MSPVCFIAPHQDDETFMGAGVRHHVEAGHDVHVLLVTTGVGSAARPATGLSPAEFVEARDDELFRATRELGVVRHNVHIAPDRPDDGALTVSHCEDMIRAFLDQHPGAWLKTYSNLSAPGKHPDHVITGQAAYNVAAELGTLDTFRCYVEPWLVTALRNANPGVTVAPERAGDKSAVLRAFDEYKIQDHPAQKYGIGYLSVKSKFEALRPDPASWYHVPVAA